MMTTLDKILEFWPQTPTTGPSPREIPNVDRWHSLTQLFTDLNFTVGAEIGTERGLFAKRMCVINPNLKLYCIDPWTAYKGYREYVSQRRLNDFYDTAKERLAPYDCHLVRKFSVDASKDFEDGSLDYVYIDGNHNLLHVIQDLWHWTPKVRSGGLVCGHDFISRINPSMGMHVVEAVHAYTQAFRIHPWFLVGRKATIEGELRDKPRSFFWIKE